MAIKTKTPKFAVAQKGNYIDITPGQKYKVLLFGRGGFYITDNEGDSRFCLADRCAQINNNRWDLK